MLKLLPLLVLGLAFAGCDSSRVYENNRDFNGAVWSIADTALFEIPIEDTTVRYNLILNVRNSMDSCFIKDASNSRYCFGSANLRNKKHVFFK